MSSLSVSSASLKPLSISAELSKPLSKSTEAFLSQFESQFESMQLETPRSKFISSLDTENTQSIASHLDNAVHKLSDLELAVGVYVILQHADHIHHIPTLARALLQMCCRLSTVSACSIDGWNTFFSLAKPDCEIPYDTLAELLQKDVSSCVVDDAFRYTTVNALQRLFLVKPPDLLAAMQSVEVAEGIAKTFVSVKEELAYLEFAAFIASPQPVGSSKDAVSEHAGVFEAVIKFISLSQNYERKIGLLQLFVAKCQATDWKCMRLLNQKNCIELVSLSNDLKVPLDCRCLTAVLEHAKVTMLSRLGLCCAIISQIKYLDFDNVKKLFTFFVSISTDNNTDVRNFLYQLLELILARGWICAEQNIDTLFQNSVTTIDNFVTGDGHLVLKSVYNNFEKVDAVYACFALGFIESFKIFAINNLAAIKSGDGTEKTIEGIERKRNFLQVLGHVYNKIIHNEKRRLVFKSAVSLIDVKATNSAAEPTLKVDNYYKPTSLKYQMLNEIFVMLK